MRIGYSTSCRLSSSRKEARHSSRLGGPEKKERRSLSFILRSVDTTTTLPYCPCGMSGHEQQFPSTTTLTHVDKAVVHGELSSSSSSSSSSSTALPLNKSNHHSSVAVSNKDDHHDKELKGEIELRTLPRDEPQQEEVDSNNDNDAVSSSSVSNTDTRDINMKQHRNHHNDNDDVTQDVSSSSPPSRCRVVWTYLSCSAIALFLTCASPHTHLWKSQKEEEEQVEIDKDVLVRLVIGSASTLLTLWFVQGSDPGYLTAEICAEACQEDGKSLLGYEDDNDQEHSDTEQQDPTKQQQQHQRDPVRSPLQEPEPVDIEAPHSSSSLSSSSSITRRTKNNGHAPIHDTEQKSVVSTLMATTSPEDQESSSSGQQQEPQQQSQYYQGTRRKVCPHCQFAPPLRSHHCRVCNRCVATFDHHCNFIGTCIGERNHCRFWWFLTCQALAFSEFTSIVASSSSFPLLQILLSSSNSSSHGGELPEGWWIIVIAKLYLYPLWFFAWIMWIVHTVFALTNMTTFECGKGPKHIDYLRGTQGTDFPFSYGCLGNVRLFCCQRDAVCSPSTKSEVAWKPILWNTPGKIVRDSEDWWEHPWQNKYWSCC